MSWLSTILRPVRFFLGATEQTRADERVSFRDGFTASQVPDADGINVLTYDTEVGAATVTPTANKVAKRNGSGSLYATSFIGNAFTYAAGQSIQYDEPFQMSNAPEDPGWVLNFSKFPAVATIGVSWRCVIKPPNGAVLKTLSAVYTPAGGHMALPAGTDRTRLLLFSYANNGTPASHGDVYDNPASVVAYEANRTLTLDLGAGITIDGTRTYVAIFKSEDGANAVAGTVLYRQARWTATIYTPIWA